MNGDSEALADIGKKPNTDDDFPPPYKNMFVGGENLYETNVYKHNSLYPIRGKTFLLIELQFTHENEVPKNHFPELVFTLAISNCYGKVRVLFFPRDNSRFRPQVA